MLIPRKLDDQRYDDIVREAVGRLPWLCPQWTDHNGHDPGITILELMAWYKEMQQYQMDQLTPSLKRELLQLAGVTPLPPQAAVCALEVAPDALPRPAYSQLSSQQEVSFELLEPVRERSITLERVVVEQAGRTTDVRELLEGSVELKPFVFGGQSGSELRLGFAGQAGQPLRLWFEVAQPAGAVRNRFEAGQTPPRDIAWTFEGAAQVQPVLDETHALSQSGYVRLHSPDDWPADGDGVRWLRLTLTREGCEEQPRLRGISDRRYQAAQQQTYARSYTFTLPAAEKQQAVLEDAFAQSAELAVFLRGAKGWEQTGKFQDIPAPGGRIIGLDLRDTAADGADNVLIVCMDALRAQDMLFDTIGRPGEELYLNLDGQTVLPQNFRLLCQTLGPDGSVHPEIWRCVDNLYTCGPRDRVFAYDPMREAISFGNGQYGAMVIPGKGSVLVMDLTVSRCSLGNVPADAGLRFTDDGQLVGNTAAYGGRDQESLADASDRLLRQLRSTGKCLSAADYERQARRTPGLRIAAAKALPDYDPHAPVGARGQAMVTVVVLPASEDERPMPDRRFLDAVNRQLERHRMIGIRTQAIGPRYVDVYINVQMRANAALDQQAVQSALAAHFSVGSADIGGLVRRSDVIALLQQLRGALDIRRLELRGVGQNVYQTPAGDLRIPPDAIAVLRQAAVELVRV